MLLAIVLAGCSGAAEDRVDRPRLPAEPPEVLVDGGAHRGTDGLPGQLVDALSAGDDQATVVGARTIDAPPDDAQPCPAAERFDADVETSRVIVGPVSYTAVVTGTTDGQPAAAMCEWDAGWQLVTVDDVAQTGTTEPVGPLYLSAVAGVVGVADGGWPEHAVVAVQDVGSWTYVIAPGGTPAAVRFTAGSDGTLGEVRYYDWFGEDVTPEESDIPEVIHGVPRTTGSGVGDG